MLANVGIKAVKNIPILRDFNKPILGIFTSFRLAVCHFLGFYYLLLLYDTYSLHTFGRKFGRCTTAF